VEDKSVGSEANWLSEAGGRALNSKPASEVPPEPNVVFLVSAPFQAFPDRFTVYSRGRRWVGREMSRPHVCASYVKLQPGLIQACCAEGREQSVRSLDGVSS